MNLGDLHVSSSKTFNQTSCYFASLCINTKLFSFRMALWLRLSLLLLFLVVVVSSLPTSLLKRRSRDNELFDGSDQLTDDEGTQSRGRHFGKKSGSKKNESAVNEKRSQRRRRKHNRQCEVTGDCPEGGGMKKLNRRGRRRRVRCNSDADCQEGQTCKERRHGGRKHHSVGAGGGINAADSSSLSSHGLKTGGNKVCRERRHGGGVHRRSGAL
ncbi:unnamed protein product [Heterobilharzia americana]|nr:unnamed protein product [Heterobilharzia americana]